MVDASAKPRKRLCPTNKASEEQGPSLAVRPSGAWLSAYVVGNCRATGPTRSTSLKKQEQRCFRATSALQVLCVARLGFRRRRPAPWGPLGAAQARLTKQLQQWQREVLGELRWHRGCWEAQACSVWRERKEGVAILAARPGPQRRCRRKTRASDANREASRLPRSNEQQSRGTQSKAANRESDNGFRGSWPSGGVPDQLFTSGPAGSRGRWEATAPGRGENELLPNPCKPGVPPWQSPARRRRQRSHLA